MLLVTIDILLLLDSVQNLCTVTNYLMSNAAVKFCHVSSKHSINSLRIFPNTHGNSSTLTLGSIRSQTVLLKQSVGSTSVMFVNHLIKSSHFGAKAHVSGFARAALHYLVFTPRSFRKQCGHQDGTYTLHTSIVSLWLRMIILKS